MKFDADRVYAEILNEVPTPAIPAIPAIRGGQIAGIAGIAAPRGKTENPAIRAVSKENASAANKHSPDIGDIKSEAENETNGQERLDKGVPPVAGYRTANRAAAPALTSNSTPDTKATPEDAELYAKILLLYGPVSYGMAMRILGWGATRAGQAEQELLKAGRITFDRLGRAVLVKDK